MTSRPPELCTSIKLISCSVILLLYFASLMGFAACSSRHTGKKTILVLEKMDEYPEQTLIPIEQGFPMALSSQTKLYKRSRRWLDDRRILHGVHHGPNPIHNSGHKGHNSFPMQADDAARKFRPPSHRKSP